MHQNTGGLDSSKFHQHKQNCPKHRGARNVLVSKFAKNAEGIETSTLSKIAENTGGLERSKFHEHKQNGPKHRGARNFL